MAHIEVKKGLDIPIKGNPSNEEIQSLPRPKFVSLNLKSFEITKFKLLAKRGEHVLAGQPLVWDKDFEDRVFVAPGSGVITEVRRGLKRRILDIVIQLDESEEQKKFDPLQLASATREEIVKKLLEGGFFAHIRQRPFGRLADPSKPPRTVFVRALESAPFVPSAERQIEGREAYFQEGLNALAKLSEGAVHLVFRKGTSCRAFLDAQNVEKHTVAGPHPASHSSLHIHHIDPVQGPDDHVWTVNALDVAAIGEFLTTGHLNFERIVSIAGTGIVEKERGVFRVRQGFPIGSLISGRNEKGLLRLISGDVLMGDQVEVDDFLGFHHTSFVALPENTSRELFHFFRPGFGKYTATRAYFSGLIGNSGKKYEFTTNQHGEHRAFIDGMIYDEVMPMNVPTMHLVKAVVSEDFDSAQELGLLEVAPEDFALATFICPCKIEMVDIMKKGLKDYAAEMLG